MLKLWWASDDRQASMDMGEHAESCDREAAEAAAWAQMRDQGHDGTGALSWEELHLTAAELLALPGEALPGLHTDDSDDEPSACWEAAREMARGGSAAGLLMGDTLWATSSRWAGRREVR